MSNTPNLALPLLETSQAQKEVTHNEALALLDVLVQARVIDAVTAAPPGAPTQGQAWIVGPAATDAWAGHDGELAVWLGGQWVFPEPQEGWRVYNEDDGSWWSFVGAAWSADLGAWQIPALNLDWIGLGGAWQNPRYRKTRDGLVTIEGAMQNGVAANDGVIFTLLAGFRPEADLIFIGYSAGGAYRINVQADGDVEVSGSNMLFSSFSGIQFYAAP